MTRFIDNGIEVPAVPKLYLWPNGGWRPEPPQEEGALTQADLGNHIDFETMQPELQPLDRVRHQTLGEGSVVGLHSPQGLAYVWWDSRSGDEPPLPVALSLLTKVEPVTAEPKVTVEQIREFVADYDESGSRDGSYANWRNEILGFIDNGPTPPKEPEGENLDPNTCNCDGNGKYNGHQGWCPKSMSVDPQPEKSLREKLKLAQLSRTDPCPDCHRKPCRYHEGLIDGIDIAEHKFHEHFYSKHEAFREVLQTVFNDPKPLGRSDRGIERLHAILLGKDA